MKSDRTSRLPWYVTIALLTVVGAGLAVKAVPRFKPRVQIHATLDMGCNLRAGPCTSSLIDGRAIQFYIEPRSIPPLEPLLLRVELIGFSAQKVQVDLNGVGMSMGYNRIPLSPVSESHFAGSGSLSVCIRDAMEWEALVNVESDNAQITAPFRFITVKGGIQP